MRFKTKEYLKGLLKESVELDSVAEITELSFNEVIFRRKDGSGLRLSLSSFINPLFVYYVLQDEMFWEKLIDIIARCTGVIFELVDEVKMFDECLALYYKGKLVAIISYDVLDKDKIEAIL